MDVDMESIKPLDHLLEKNECFLGYEAKGRLNTAIVGALIGNQFLKECMLEMERRHLAKQPYLIAPEIATLINDRTSKKPKLYPPETFYPYNPFDRTKATSVLMMSDVTEHTHTIHHWNSEWNHSTLERMIRLLRKVSLWISNKH